MRRRGSIRRRIPIVSPQHRQETREKREELREMRVAEAIARQNARALDVEDFTRFKPEVAAAVAAVIGMPIDEFIAAIDTEIQRASSEPRRIAP